MRINKFLHDNRNKIVVVLVAVLGFFVITQLLNQNAIKENQKQQQIFANSQYVDIPEYKDQPQYYTITNTTTEGTTEGTTEDTEEQQNNNNSTNIIATFINYCNKKEYENAYNILTTECKEELFPTITDFIEKYCNNIFTEQKTYSLEKKGSTYNLDIYSIRIFKNPLSTGNYEQGSVIEDYYTIAKTEEGNKLNINKYIGRIQIGKNSQKQNIRITAIYKDIYADYERYQIKVENKTGKTILLNGENTIDTVYGLDENGVKYSAFIYELTENEMKIENNFSKTIKIKLNKQYSTTNSAKILSFTNIILDYEEYKSLENKAEYNDILNMKASI